MLTKRKIDNVISVLEGLQNNKQQFIDLYCALNQEVRKVIENAFYAGMTRNQVARNHQIIVHKKNGINIIEINALDIYDSLYIIKQFIDHKGG